MAGKFEGTITITFSEVVENHKGMEKIGTLAKRGLSIKDLKKAQKKFIAAGASAELIELNNLLPEEIEGEPAAILIIHNGIDLLLGSGGRKKLLAEQLEYQWDTKALIRGKVVNKRARHNVCYADLSQDPEIAQGKGTVIDFADLPLLSKVRESLPQYIGDKASTLFAEGNKYYDPATTYIGFHGDGERKIVIVLRLGKTMPLYYQWYQRSKSIGKLLHMELKAGDIYLMSEKATGNDWLKKVIPTLRHAAGAVKMIDQ